MLGGHRVEINRFTRGQPFRQAIDQFGQFLTDQDKAVADVLTKLGLAS